MVLNKRNPNGLIRHMSWVSVVQETKIRGMRWGKVTLTVFRFEKLFSPSPSANAVDASSSKVTIKPSIPQIEQNRSQFELLSYQVFAVALADSSSIRSVPPGSQNFASR